MSDLPNAGGISFALNPIQLRVEKTVRHPQQLPGRLITHTHHAIQYVLPIITPNRPSSSLISS
jgi:hypothetical protein